MADTNLSSWEKCKIKKVTPTCKLVNPLLLNTDNRTLTNDELNNYECVWNINETDHSCRDISFSNKNNDSLQGTAKLQGDFCRTMLVLQNKSTNKVQLIEVGKCHLRRVSQKPVLRTNYDNDEIDATYEDNKSQLLKAFGSKKSKRQSDIGTKMRINSQMMTSQIKNTAADVSIDVEDLALREQTTDTCVPLCHRDASSPEDVYLVEDFLTSLELDSMEDEAFTIFHLLPFTEEESGYSKFFTDSLDRLQNKISIEKIKIFLFVEVLMRFLNIPSDKMKKTDPAKLIGKKTCPFSSFIAKKIIDDYTVEGIHTRFRNTVMDDKIVIHIMALLVVACGSCNIDELSRCLPSFSITKFGQIARTLCLSTRDKITWFIKLPLPAQKSFYMKKRK